jgi:hypothetical protein
MKKQSVSKTVQWEKENLPLLAGFVIIVSCFVMTLTKLSAIGPETVTTNHSLVNAEPTPACTTSPEVFSGIGARLEQTKSKVYVLEVIPDSPAEKGKIMPGDALFQVDSAPVVDVDDAVSRIRGSAGTSVRLVLYRGNLRLDKTLVRENITDAKTLICQ